MKRRIVTSFFAGLTMLVLILEPKTALLGAQEGILLCLQVVIPSLFPLFVLTMLLTSSVSFRFLEKIGKLCGIPADCGAILVPALLGGYPVGAQAVTQAYHDGKLKKCSAQRLLGFCSNAGPAFVFGMVAQQFDSVSAGWILWLIHLACAVLVGILLPGKDDKNVKLQDAHPIGIQTALQRSMKVMAGICGWIVLFRVVIAFLEKWVLWLLPDAAAIAIMGLLELSNGCCSLAEIENPGLRFVMASGMLSFGGFCVMMQTASVSKELGIRSYVKGKLLQTLFSLVLAFLAQRILFSSDSRFVLSPIVQLFGPIFLVFTAIFVRMREKNSSIPAMGGV